MVVKDLTAPFIVAALAFAMPVYAQDASQPARPQTVIALTDCLALSVANDRLACFDRTAQALDTALRSGELVVVDRAQATEARRQAFGSITALANIFQPSQSDDAIDAIETTLTRAGPSGDGRWTFVLADGSVWRQTDTDRVTIRNRAGEAVQVRRGALGSYLLTVGRSSAIRVRRQ